MNQTLTKPASVPTEKPSATDDQRALPSNPETLPVIDISGFRTGNEHSKKSIASQLGQAARRTGFFYIKGHGIDQSLIDGLFAASKEFHEMPRSFKMKHWCGFTTNHRGYVPFEENGVKFPASLNMNEAYDLSFEAPEDHPDYLAKWRMTGPNVWPDIENWQETVSNYYQAVFDLGLTLMDALCIELDIDSQRLKQHINCPTSQLRMLRYIENDLPQTKDVVGIDAHSDFECFTILLQGAPGLQVMNAEDYWVEAPPLPGCFIVNIGDIFETWTGGRYKSTQHRVVNTGKERYSFPLFFGLDYHTVVETLEEFKTPDSIEKYPPIEAGQHLMRMTVNTFRYMHEAYKHGEFDLGVEVPEESPFARDAKFIDEPMI
ncbi:MAG: isopenicillin N synthase family dioxygenase [Granulosicoccus sp.]